MGNRRRRRRRHCVDSCLTRAGCSPALTAAAPVGARPADRSSCSSGVVVAAGSTPLSDHFSRSASSVDLKLSGGQAADFHLRQTYTKSGLISQVRWFAQSDREQKTGTSEQRSSGSSSGSMGNLRARNKQTRPRGAKATHQPAKQLRRRR